MTSIQRLVVALLCFLAVPVSASEDIFRLFFRYGFGDGQIGDPESEPTEEDIKALLCVTNDFLSESLQNYTKDDSVQMTAIEIDWGFEDWIYNGTEPEAPRNVPVIVNFTAYVSTEDGSEPPTNQDLWEATKYFDYFSYIMNYLWTMPEENFFKDTRGIWYEPFIEPEVKGQMAQNDECPAPEPEEAGPNRISSFNLTTMEPSMIPTIAPTMMPTLRRGGISLDLNLTTPTPSLAPTTFPSTAPSPKPVGRASSFDLATLAPTTPDEEMVYFTIQIDFFAGKEKEPLDEEVEAMMCQTDKFFEKTLKDAISPDVEVFSANIGWEWDEKAALPSRVEFFANATLPDGTHVPAEDVFNAMEAVDVKMFVEDYVWQSDKYQENVFYQTEDIFFAGSYTGADNPPEPHVGKIAKADCSRR